MRALSATQREAVARLIYSQDGFSGGPTFDQQTDEWKAMYGRMAGAVLEWAEVEKQHAIQAERDRFIGLIDAIPNLRIAVPRVERTATEYKADLLAAVSLGEEAL